MEKAKRTAFEIYQEGSEATDTQVCDLIVRHSKLSQQAPRLRAILDLAATIPALVVPIAELGDRSTTDTVIATIPSGAGGTDATANFVTVNGVYHRAYLPKCCRRHTDHHQYRH